MWFVFAVLTVAVVASAGLARRFAGKQDFIVRITSTAGVLFGLVAVVFYLSAREAVSASEMLRYFPVAVLRLASVVAVLAALDLFSRSATSFVTPTYGAFAALVCVTAFGALTDTAETAGIILTAAGAAGIYMLTAYMSRKPSRQTDVSQTRARVALAEIVIPLAVFALCLATAIADAVYLDEMNLAGKESAIVTQGAVCFAAGVICIVYRTLSLRAARREAYSKVTANAEKRIFDEMRSEDKRADFSSGAVTVADAVSEENTANAKPTGEKSSAVGSVVAYVKDSKWLIACAVACVAGSVTAVYAAALNAVAAIPLMASALVAPALSAKLFAKAKTAAIAVACLAVVVGGIISFGISLAL